MSFKRFDPEDIVISADSVTAPAWSNNQTTLSTFFTSSAQVVRTSGDYYFNIYKDNVNLTSSANSQFSVAFGHRLGSGSLRFNSNVVGNTPSTVVYKSTRTLVLGTEEDEFTFGDITPEYVYTINVDRGRYKEKLLPQSLTLKLKNGSDEIVLTDNSKYVATETFTDAGRVYELISGSQGVKTSSTLDSGSAGYTISSGSYGKFLPDIGMLILNGAALDAPVNNGGIALSTGTSDNSDDENNQKLFNAISASGEFTLRSEETITSNYVFVRARNSEFNYTTNPSNITGSGELRHDIMIDSPQGFITSVGLYNDNNDLLGVAKLSRPLIKDFTKEALIRIKLDY